MASFSHQPRCAGHLDPWPGWLQRLSSQTNPDGGFRANTLAISLFFAVRGAMVPSVADVATRWEPKIEYPMSTPENSLQTRADIIEAASTAYSHVKPLTVKDDPEGSHHQPGTGSGLEIYRQRGKSAAISGVDGADGVCRRRGCAMGAKRRRLRDSCPI